MTYTCSHTATKHFDYSSKDLIDFISGLNYDKTLDIKDEFRYGWCGWFQYALLSKLGVGEPYAIYEKGKHTGGEFWDDHVVIKISEYFIDVCGIYTEAELLARCVEECRQNKTPIAEFKVMKGDKFDEQQYDSNPRVVLLAEKIADMILEDIKTQCQL